MANPVFVNLHRLQAATSDRSLWDGLLPQFVSNSCGGSSKVEDISSRAPIVAMQNSTDHHL